MVYDHIVKQDGQTYLPGEDVPDMGSIKCNSVNGNVRSYELLSADITKLPQYDDLSTGSGAYCTDTAQLYKYEATTKTWYLQG